MTRDSLSSKKERNVHTSFKFSSSIDWKQSGAVLRNFDDGHIPEKFRKNRKNCADAAEISKQNDDTQFQFSRLADYPDLFHDRVAQVHVYQNAVQEELVDYFYDYTVKREHPAWGDYVTLQEIQDYWKLHEHNASIDYTMDLGPGTPNRQCLVALVARYLDLAMGKACKKHGLPKNPDHVYRDETGVTTTKRDEQLWTLQDTDQRIHGVAVWGLAANTGSQVSYHLDYAEQIRYRHNIIVPPLLAGTLQCTRAHIQGGDFFANLRGLEHYQEHGYKTKKKKLGDIESDPSMVRIPYRFNQLTCHLGHLPHGSTPIKVIEDQSAKRVILGFNVFGHDVGKIVQQAPEHSEEFRRQVQEQRIQLHQEKQKVSLDAVKSNKALSKLLVLAKREKIKREYQQAIQGLEMELPSLLPCKVQDLIDYFFRKYQDLCWPSTPLDIHIYLDRQVRNGKFSIIVDENYAATNTKSTGTSALSSSEGRCNEMGLIPLMSTIIYQHEQCEGRSDSSVVGSFSLP